MRLFNHFILMLKGQLLLTALVTGTNFGNLQHKYLRQKKMIQILTIERIKNLYIIV